MESLLEVGKVVEVTSHLRITWGLAVHHARFKAEEYRVMAEIAQGKVKPEQLRPGSVQSGRQERKK